VAALEALEATRFLVSVEMRVSAVTDRADVVLPVAAASEKAGTFVNWEGRPGSFGAALAVPEARTDLQVLGALADAMDVHLGLPDDAAARRELNALVPDITSSFAGVPSAIPHGSAGGPPTEAMPAATAGSPARAAGSAGGSGGGSPREGTASRSGGPGVTPRADTGGPGVIPRDSTVLATWHNLLDAGRMQDGEPNLAGTAHAAVAKMSAATAAEAGVGDGGKVAVATERGAITVPVEVADMPDRVVWLPTNSAGCAVRAQLGAGHGSLVTLRSAQ